jgi:TM2 domain-containing membrane protein YozV
MTLSTDQQMLIEQRISNDAKSPVVAYLIWFFLGQLGIHRFFLGKKHGVTMLVLFLLGIFTSWLLIGIPMLIAVFIMWIMDAFKISGWVSEERDALRQKLTEEAAA